jgi:hypothetical protein
MYYLYLCICTSAKCMSVELKVYLFIWSLNFRFSMSLSLSPNSLYRQTTNCTEGGGLTREHCMLQCLKIVLWGFYHLDFFEFLIAWSVKTWWGNHLFLRGGLEIFWPRISWLLSKIKILISKSFAQIYIFFVTMWVCKIKGKNRSSNYQVGPLNVFLQDLELT